MLYSVWKPELSLYEYYQDGKNFLDESPTPIARARTKLGSSMNDISWKVPNGSRKVGSGAIAKGIVVHQGLGSDDTITAFLGGTGIVVLVGGLALAWYLADRGII